MVLSGGSSLRPAQPFQHAPQHFVERARAELPSPKKRRDLVKA
jgi:hypothetical protein